MPSAWRRAFVKRGHQVTVMTTQYEPSLPREETMDGVKIIRVPVVARVSKGVLAPTFGLVATKLVANHDVVQMHLPQFDAPGVALRARLLGKPAVLTYHCDLLLPPGFFNRLVNAVVDFQNNMAGRLSNHIVTYTQDYADNSPYLSRYKSKLTPILPPVEMPDPLPGAVEAFAQEHHINERRPVIGMVTRFASEKGVEILLDALPTILKKYPKAQVLYAGQHQNVMGEQAYFDRLIPQIREYEVLGSLDIFRQSRSDRPGSSLSQPGCVDRSFPELHRGVWPGADRSDDERCAVCPFGAARGAAAGQDAWDGTRRPDR